jgi:predicted nuclease of predicted toxin-antitoxin system
VRLLFDHNLSPALAICLQDIYPNSSHVYLLGLDKASDTEIWQYARQEEFVIVTKDADYSELGLIRGFPPKVVWIRRGNCKTATIEALLRNHYSDLKIMEAIISIGILTLV